MDDKGSDKGTDVASYIPIDPLSVPGIADNLWSVEGAFVLTILGSNDRHQNAVELFYIWQSRWTRA